MGEIKFVTGLLLTTLFTLAIVMFVIQFGDENDSAVLLSNDSDYSGIQDSLVGDVQDFNEDAEDSVDTLMSTTQEAGDQSASSGGQFKVGAFTMIRMATVIITVVFTKIFGDDIGFGIFLTAITSILVWMIGLYIWKAWKGSPD